MNTDDIKNIETQLKEIWEKYSHLGKERVSEVWAAITGNHDNQNHDTQNNDNQ